MARVEWTELEDAVIVYSYLVYGVEVTSELQAMVPRHSAESIEMRLKNVQFIATDGAHGLRNVAALTRHVWTNIRAGGVGD